MLAGSVTDRRDVFVSYAGPDRPWAEWAAWQLESAGYTVELDVWDWSPGDNVTLRINDALARAEQVLALWSPAYFERHRFTLDEWTAVLAATPDTRRRLVPVRVAAVDPEPVLRPILYADLFGLDEATARATLLTAMGGAQRPGHAPAFPPAGGVAEGPRVPGSLPGVWSVPPRNPAFAGREAMLAGLREGLQVRGRTVVQAMRGLGGVGKTQMAIEYAHLFAGEYGLVWWIDAEQTGLVGEQLAALAVAAGWAAPDVPVAAGVAAARERLRTRDRWLVVFDNAADGPAVRPWLPQGPGHVLITSRSADFVGVAAPVEVDTFTRAESVLFLHSYLPSLDPADADRLAAALGDLPLGLTQAAGLLVETGMPAGEYLQELDRHAAGVLDEHRPVDYDRSLAAAVGLSVEKLRRVDPAGLQLARVCAWLAPEPVPLSWFATAGEGVLPQPLAATATVRLALRRTVGRLANLGLARLAGDTILWHRLTQAVLREHDDSSGLEQARRLVAAAEPADDGTDPQSWPAWAALLPHLLAVDPATATTDVRATACNGLWYLLMRGEYRTALPLAEHWHHTWREASGADAAYVRWVTAQLATTYQHLGEHDQARAMNQDLLTHGRRILGEDHRNTLTYANNFANNLRELGELEQARDLHLDTLTRSRRVLGEDHPGTLTSANNVAATLFALNEFEQARDLHLDTLTRRRRVLGEDHPDALTSAVNLATVLFVLGEIEQARDLDSDTLARCRRVLGENHPDTLDCANNLADDLRALGELEQAGDLESDTQARRRRMLGED
jgi:tetratricopeptide (TPR) repeat protein